MRLTDLQIRKIGSPKTGQKTYFDDGLPGFGIRVSQGGSKSFVVLLGKARRRQTIGRYPETSLATARREAKRLQGSVSLDDLAKSPTVAFGEAKKRFLADAQTRTKFRTVDEYRRLLKRHFEIAKPLSAIKRQDIMAVIERLRDTPSEAKHAFVAIRTLMNWCMRHGLVEKSPVPALTFKLDARSRVLSDDELRVVWGRAGEVGYPYGQIVKLLILTGQRRGEIAGLRRDWIKDAEIAFPPGFTKNKREHRIPIGPLASHLIDAIPKEGELLFPSRYEESKPFNGWSKAKWQFDQPLPFADYTLHDLRRTYSSNLAKLGVPIHVTEKLLNHVSGTISGVAAVYNRHTYWDEMREAVVAFECQLESLMIPLAENQSY